MVGRVWGSLLSASAVDRRACTWGIPWCDTCDSRIHARARRRGCDRPIQGYDVNGCESQVRPLYLLGYSRRCLENAHDSPALQFRTASYFGAVR
jgi:hypothetical protein